MRFSFLQIVCLVSDFACAIGLCFCLFTDWICLRGQTNPIKVKELLLHTGFFALVASSALVSQLSTNLLQLQFQELSDLLLAGKVDVKTSTPLYNQTCHINSEI